MNRRHFFSKISLAIGGGILGFNWLLQDRRETVSASPVKNRRCIALAGAEFGTDKIDFCNENLGTFARDYTYNSEKSIRYFCDRGIDRFRIALRWERLQPQLGKDLNLAELGRLKKLLQSIRHNNGDAILDIHNYGRYVLVHQSMIRETIIDESIRGEVPVSAAHFGNLWRRLSSEFRDDPAVYAYGLMNEPHDMGRSDWKKISQQAVDAIRANGDGKRLLISGTDWSNSHRFAIANGPKAWIQDGMQNHAYEAHCYLDADYSGKYRLSFDKEQVRDRSFLQRPMQRLKPFIEWCQTNGVDGFLGEIGVPGNDPRWLPLLQEQIAYAKQSGIDSCYWAAGEWWGDYPLSVQPRSRFQRDAPQLAVLVHS